MHRRLLELARDSRLSLSLTILAGLLGGLLTIWQASLLTQIINAVFLQSQTLDAVLGALSLMLVVIALRGLLTWGGAVAATAVAVRIKTDLRQRLFAHLLRLGPAYARGERSGELANAAVEGVEALDAYFSQYLPQLAVAALVPLVIIILVFPLDPLSGVILLLTAPLIPIFMILIGKAAEALTKRQYETLSRLSAHFLDSLQGLTTLKLFGASKSHAKTIDEVNGRFRDATLNVLRVTFISALALELIATLSTAIVAVEVGIRLLYGNLAFQQALFLLVIAPEFYIPMRMLGMRYHAGMSGVTAAKRIFEILDTKVNDQPVPEDGFSVVNGQSFIVFNNVSFTYPGEEKPALQNINIEIKPGQHTALVGASGAGKSTLVSLLLRFVEPGSGQIMACPRGVGVNDENLASFAPDDWRRQVAWVSQKPYLFHDTIAANIRLAKPDATDDEVVAAARAAHLHDFIQSLPAGYETLVSEGGARLSGGEAQRLALARAFLKDAPILILNEPTSSLDPQLETLLEESIRRLMQGRTARSEQRRTVLTIAHRLNTVFHADQIIVLDEGRVAESGTHAELLAMNGIYARLVGAYADEIDDGTRNTDNRQRMFADDTLTTKPESVSSKSPVASIPHRLLSIIYRLLFFLNGSWKSVAGSVLLGAATIASSMALMGASAWLISAAALHPSIADLGVAIVGVRFFGIARGVFRYLERLVSHRVTFRLLARLRTWFYTALEPLAPARLMQYRSGDLLARVVADVETLENFYARVVSPPLVALVVAVGTAFFLGVYNPWLGWALLGFLFALGVLVPLLAQALGRGPGRELIARRADLHVQLVDGIQGMADLLAFGRQADCNQKIELAGKDYARLQHRMGWISGLNDGLGVLLTNLGLWTVLALAIPHVTAGEIPGVVLAALALVTVASFEAVTPLPLAAQMLGSSLEAARRLFDVVDAEPVINMVGAGSPRPKERGTSSGQVVFRDVSFGYGENLVLNGINFQLEKGQSLAIVGPSGAGKSTIVNLLLRFWDYGQGEIMLAGRSLKSLTSDEARRKLAVVAQNVYFFNATIRQNLFLANAQATQEQIEIAAQKAQIHDFITGLPKGYDTWIGEQGLRLSGGERQRLAIARALLKDAPILVLDEPAANLDPLTERALMDALFAAMQGRTALMITHRLTGLERFDSILVLERGRIVERGTHAGLLAQSGLYRQLWTIQNRILSENLPG